MKSKLVLIPAALAALGTLAAPAFADTVVVKHPAHVIHHHHVVVVRGHMHHHAKKVVVIHKDVH